ncbi:hypothetical protein NP493_885g01021 [Ridgeia piscesae]|uniref:Uncharacterized protein n=1 Tax=Ridgeia piscesae TaxID=27915 RepID=A0AAD9KMS3_RIDPI|nr:hypothetical protein NP493_885g01021 [Ridgeia piscesae]
MLDCVVTHDEADITLRSYKLKAVAEGAQTIRILSDDTDVFVLLVYWTSRMRVLGQPGATHAQLQQTACTFFLPLYGQKGCTTMNDAHCHKKPPPLKKLPPTDANLQLHVLQAHLQMLLTNVVHLKKLETLPTLVGTKAPPLHRPSQQHQLLPKHYWM